MTVTNPYKARAMIPIDSDMFFGRDLVSGQFNHSLEKKIDFIEPKSLKEIYFPIKAGKPIETTIQGTLTFRDRGSIDKQKGETPSSTVGKMPTILAMKISWPPAITIPLCATACAGAIKPPCSPASKPTAFPTNDSRLFMSIYKASMMKKTSIPHLLLPSRRN